MRKNFLIKIAFFIVSMTIMSPATYAQTILVDEASGDPLVKASIFDRYGRFIGVSSENGEVPSDIDAGAYPIIVRYVGYVPVEISAPNSGKIGLTESEYNLPEVVVDDQSRNMLYLTGYVRTYGSGTTSNDTVTSYKEEIVDFMIPRTKKAKFKGWKKARVLASHTYENIKKKERDTLIYKEGEKTDFGGSFNITEVHKIPEPVRNGEKEWYVVDGKYYPKETWKVIGDNYILEEDDLADYKDHKYAPSILKIFGASASMNQAEYKYKFDKTDREEIIPEDFLEMTEIWNLDLTGRLFKKGFNSDDPINLNYYTEIYVTDRQYLTQDEAKELKNNKPVVIDSKIEAPKGIPAPLPQMEDLKKRVIESRKEK